MTTQTYATQVTSYYLAAVAAAEADGPMVNIAGGTLVVGDGNGVVPAISALIAANGVTHEVWRGQTISAVAVDANNAAQLDITCEIPAAIGGVEIGPFNVTEFAILDASGSCCVVGTTNLAKTTSGEGQTSDLVWIAAIVAGVGQVTVTPPSGSYASMTQVIAGYNANLPGVAAPITKTYSTISKGWTNRVIGIAPASQPADAVTPTTSAAAMGAGRPASAAEFAGAAPTAGGFPWPWPTLQQIGAALSALWAAITAAKSPTRILYIAVTETIVLGANETRAKVKAWGGGGGGGGTAYVAGALATGGGGGEYREGYFTGLAGSITATIGAGGVGGAADGANAGADGGATSFGALLTANGGGGGAGSASGVPLTNGAGGSGGSGGSLDLPGMPGEGGLTTSGLILGLGGGAAFGSGHSHFNASGGTGFNGGAGQFPGQGGGNGAGGGAGASGSDGLMVVELYP